MPILRISCAVDKEACPNNLAPTNSTTAKWLWRRPCCLFFLIEWWDFGSADFAKYHPYGV